MKYVPAHLRLLAVAVVLAALAFLVSAARADVPFQEIRHSSRMSIGGPDSKLELVTSQAELLVAWREMGRFDALPSIDFRRNSALFYFDRLKATGGFVVSVERISIRGGVMEVDIVESIPGSSCGVTLEAAQPSVAVTTIPWKGAVEPVVRTVIHQCN
jgi:hypothetical protein